MTSSSHKPVVLIVLDGWGWREDATHNPIVEAKTPFWDSLWARYAHSLLDASEESVGLPEGQVGNSEVGHMTIGAGTVIDTDLVRITKAIRENKLGDNPAIAQLFDHVKKHDSVLHLQGLVSPGGVHSHSEHLYALLRLARQAGIRSIAIHAFTDGRDTAPQSADKYLGDLESKIEELGIGHIATIAGRFYAMDRDNNWDRLAKVEDAIFHAKGPVVEGRKASAHVRALHAEGKVDEHLEPIIFLDEDGKSYAIKENDGVLFFNFRSDRARMLSKKIAERIDAHNICFVTMTEYDKTIKSTVAFPPVGVVTTLAAQVSQAGLTQAHVAETEKYAHATYFLNGGRETPHEGERHILVESRKDVTTHDQAPKMRAAEIADKAVACIEQSTDFIFINFANADMVGHTGNRDAIIEAVEEVDAQLKRVVAAAQEKGGIVFITADHGNAETNVDPATGQKHTAHTNNLVPAILMKEGVSLQDGTLADVAPTILELLGLPKPSSMTGTSLMVG